MEEDSLHISLRLSITTWFISSYIACNEKKRKEIEEKGKGKE